MRGQIELIQFILGVTPDNVWGPQSQAALNALLGLHIGKASSFADPTDIIAFQKAKARGLTDHEAFAFGDNGIGEWEDDTTKGNWCAVSKADIIANWGSLDAGKHQDIIITIAGKTHTVSVGDIMTPNLSSGAVVDMNPGACALFGLKPPILVPVQWRWDEPHYA